MKKPTVKKVIPSLKELKKTKTINEEQIKFLNAVKQLHTKFVTPFDDKNSQNKQFNRYITSIHAENLDKFLNIFDFSSYYMKSLYKSMKTDSGDYFSNLFKNHFATNFQHLNNLTQSFINKQSNPLLKRSVTINDIKNSSFPTKIPQTINPIDSSQHISCIPNKPKKLLVLDLDETLIHCKTEQETIPATKQYDKLLKIITSDNKEMNIYIFIRPYLQSFLKTMSKYYNIVVFSGSNENYGKAVCHYLDPNKKYI